MRQSETAITIIALGLGLLLTWFMVFGILLLGQLSQLFSEGKTSSKLWLMLLATSSSGILLIYLVRQWLKGLKVRLSAPQSPRKNPLEARDKETLLELARQRAFTLQEAHKAISAHPADMAYMLNLLLQQGKLRAVEENNVVKYHLTKMP